jgi:hypothetical protein
VAEQSLRAMSAQSDVARATLGTLLRIHLTYLWRHQRRLSPAQPSRFTELIQRRKLVDRDPCIALLTDKLGVKQTVAVRSGDEDWSAVRRAAAAWMRRPSGRWLDEWGYVT